MNKIFTLVLFVLALSTLSSARLKPNQLAGKWKYKILLYNGQLEGWFEFSLKDEVFEGKNIQSDGNISKLSDIKINNKNETLCFKLVRENDVPIEFILIFNDNKFKGKGWISDESFEITGDKITIQ